MDMDEEYKDAAIQGMMDYLGQIIEEEIDFIGDITGLPLKIYWHIEYGTADMRKLVGRMRESSDRIERRKMMFPLNHLYGVYRN